MAYISTQPAGVFTPNKHGRKHIMRVVGGDTWKFDVNLYSAEDARVPATPENSIVKISLAETQFDNPIWIGGWYSGIEPDEVRADLMHVAIPNTLTKSLRRGSYLFSIRVSDILKSVFVTEVEGSFLVEYRPTSEQHSIPYKEETCIKTSQSTDTYEDISDYKYPRNGENN